MRNPTVVDIFCGVGGISKGFQEAGFDIILGIDTNQHALDIFKKQFPEASIIGDDITKINSEDIERILGGRKVNVLVGGPPCQGFSMAGKRRPSDQRNTLFYEFARLAKEIRPSWVLMENVMGLLSAKTFSNRNVIDVIKEAFAPEFDIRPFKVNAADYGVPQKRKRVIIVGNRKGIDFQIDLPKRKWTPAENVLSKESEIDKKYFYSRRLICGSLRREKINREKGLGFKWQFIRPDKPSYTIPARYWKDGANALIKYSMTKIRRLTEWECAKIQGLDPKLFEGGKDDYIAIGNAVPPKIVEPFAQRMKSYGF